MLALVLAAASSTEQLSVVVSPGTGSLAGDVTPICSGGSGCRQALTVTFSSAMIALGEDFGPGPLPHDVVPFELFPPIPGKLRWVTTTIARFDPDSDYPPSLTFALQLTGMASRAGATLAPDSTTTWQFSTPALKMAVEKVTSRGQALPRPSTCTPPPPRTPSIRCTQPAPSSSPAGRGSRRSNQSSPMLTRFLLMV
jgi:hypothetical protein